MVKIKALVLAAGYAARLYPLTKDTPKPLLKVAGRPIIEYIIRKLEEIPSVSRIYIITNNKFELDLIRWAQGFDAGKPIEIINDNTNSNDDRLGALGDINYALSSKAMNDDVIVIAGDNLFDLQLNEVVSVFKKRRNCVIVLNDVGDLELAKNYGVVEVKDNIVVNFEEKPAAPKSTIVSTGIYLFPKGTVDLIGRYIAQGYNADKTGDFIKWLHKQEDVYAYITDKAWYDIGSFEQLEEANRHFKGLK